MARKQAAPRRRRPRARPLAALARALEHTFHQVVTDLADLDAQFALIGGLAIGVRVTPRTTTDIDIAVSIEDDAKADALIFALRQRGYRIGDVFQRSDGRLATVRTTLPDEPQILVDFLFASARIEPEVVAAASTEEVYPRTRAPVAQPWHLLAMKVKANRPKDSIDIHHLIEQATAAELRKAEAALRLIQRRGGDPERDLVSELRKHVVHVRRPHEDMRPVRRRR